MSAIACTAERFDRDDAPCGEPATVRLTITGADTPNTLREGSAATSYNLDREPRCDECARIDRAVAERFYGASDGATTEPIA